MVNLPADLYSVVVYPLIYIFPAYAANALPVLFSGGGPLDRKRKLWGKRVLGEHKTVYGTLSAAIGGVLVGLVYTQFGALGYMLPIAIMLTLGAISGDLLGSFIKRQLGLKSGSSVFLLDQYGFYVLALAFAFRLGSMPGLYGMAFITLLTGVLHIATNRAAYMLRLKKVPW